MVNRFVLGATCGIALGLSGCTKPPVTTEPTPTVPVTVEDVKRHLEAEEDGIRTKGKDLITAERLGFAHVIESIDGSNPTAKIGRALYDTLSDGETITFTSANSDNRGIPLCFRTDGNPDTPLQECP